MNILANYASSYVSAFDVALSARRAETRQGEGKIEARTQGRLARLLFPARHTEARAA